MVSVTPVSVTPVQVMMVFILPFPTAHVIYFTEQSDWYDNMLMHFFFTSEPAQTLFFDDATGHAQKIWSGTLLLKCTLGDLTPRMQSANIMAYGSTPYVGMTPKKNGGHNKSAQMTRSKCLR